MAGNLCYSRVRGDEPAVCRREVSLHARSFIGFAPSEHAHPRILEIATRKAKRQTVRRKGPQGQLALLRKQLRTLRGERAKDLRRERLLRKKTDAQAHELAGHKRQTKEFLDWTLQSLYAVGLGLEVSRSLMETNSRQAAHDLDSSISQLNSLIERLRVALTGQ